MVECSAVCELSDINNIRVNFNCIYIYNRFEKISLHSSEETQLDSFGYCLCRYQILCH